jgi:tetratricopeptide (TPR) repeat protein
MNKEDLKHLLMCTEERTALSLNENNVICKIIHNMVKDAIDGRHWTLAERYCGAGLALARQGRREDWHAEFEKCMGRVKLRNLDDETVRRLQHARTLYAHQNNLAGIAECQLLLGDYYRKTGENWLAKLHYRQSLELFHEIGNEDGIAVVSHYLSIILRREGNFTEAAELQRQFVRYFIGVNV